MAPLLRAQPGDLFTHHTDVGAAHNPYEEPDTFEFLGRADGSTHVHKGWFLMRLVSTESRGICQAGPTRNRGPTAACWTRWARGRCGSSETTGAVHEMAATEKALLANKVKKASQELYRLFQVKNVNICTRCTRSCKKCFPR